MTTLVTGATGFIGSHVAAELLEGGESVRVLVRSPDKLPEVGLDPERLEVVVGDLADSATLPPALDGVERVHHIAGLVETKGGNAKLLYEANVTSTDNLFAACAEAGVERIVYLASIYALAGGGRMPAHEDSEWTLGDLAVDYVQANRAAELKARAWSERGLPIVFVYPNFCYGPNDVYDSSSALIVGFLKGQMALYPTGGQNAMDVRDAAHGLVLGMEHGRPGERYLVGGENRTYKELLEMLADITGRRAPLGPMPPAVGRASGRLAERLLDEPPLDAQASLLLERTFWYDDSWARRELGYTSRPLEETMREAVAWHQERLERA